MLISVLLGFFIVAFQVKLPDFAAKTIQLFSGSVTAVVLFSIGIFMGMHKIGNIRKWSQVAAFAFFTMLVLPAVFYLAIRSANMSDEQMKATIIDAAMPLGLTPYALSVQYKLETTLIARIVVFGTIISVFTIPLWMVWVG
jgi:predicted permease